MVSHAPRSALCALLALAVMSSACGPHGVTLTSFLTLHLWGPEFADTSVARLVRVELKGGGWPPWQSAPKSLSGGEDYGVYGRKWPVRVPSSGTLLLRVALVAPTGDTLVSSPWDTIHLQHAYKYSIAVGVADSSGPNDVCGPTFKGYRIPANRFVRYDSLLVDISGIELGAIC